MYIACEKCKYNHDGECDFYVMGSGNEIDMPCYREKELIKEAADNFIQALLEQKVRSKKMGMNKVITVDGETLKALEVLASVKCDDIPCTLCELFTPNLNGNCISSQASSILQNIGREYE